LNGLILQPSKNNIREDKLIIMRDCLLWQSFQDTTHNFSIQMQHLFHIFLFLHFWMFFVVKHFNFIISSMLILLKFHFLLRSKMWKVCVLLPSLSKAFYRNTCVSFHLLSLSHLCIEQQNIHKTSNNCTKSIKTMSKTLKTVTKTSDQLRRQ
jgi:hypothetical protein